jgi:hypothetical protein
VPASVKVRAGQKMATFTAQARRPAQVDVSVTHAGARLIRPVRITGLVISEVFYSKAGDSNGFQWVEIANDSNITLDLSSYTLGAGNASFMETQLPLSGTIPAHGCIVVGGPQSNASNGSPSFALTKDFEPDLDAGMAKAAGIGLFATGTSGMTPTLRGIDVVVYGAAGVENTSLRDRDGQLAAVWAGAAAGNSLRRVNDTIWQPTTDPLDVRPGTCEVLNDE